MAGQVKCPRKAGGKELGMRAKRTQSVEVLKRLVRKNGVPKILLIDNGHIYVPAKSENSLKKSANI